MPVIIAKAQLKVVIEALFESISVTLFNRFSGDRVS